MGIGPIGPILYLGAFATSSVSPLPSRCLPLARPRVLLIGRSESADPALWSCIRRRFPRSTLFRELRFPVVPIKPLKRLLLLQPLPPQPTQFGQKAVSSVSLDCRFLKGCGPIFL